VGVEEALCDGVGGGVSVAQQGGAGADDGGGGVEGLRRQNRPLPARSTCSSRRSPRLWPGGGVEVRAVFDNRLRVRRCQSSRRVQRSRRSSAHQDCNSGD